MEENPQGLELFIAWWMEARQPARLRAVHGIKQRAWVAAQILDFSDIVPFLFQNYGFELTLEQMTDTTLLATCCDRTCR